MIVFDRKGMSVTVRIGRITVAARLFLQRRSGKWYRRAWPMFAKVPGWDLGVVLIS